MSSTVGDQAVWAMHSSRDRDQQYSFVRKFLKREPDESQAKVTLLQQQNHQRTEMLIQQKSQSAEPTRERLRENPKLNIFKYREIGQIALL